MKTKRPGLHLDLQNWIQVKRAKLAVGSAGLIHSDAHLVAGCLSPNCGDQSSAERPVETGSAGFVSAADDADWKSRTLGNYLLLATDIESADWSQPIRCVDRATGEQKLCKLLSVTNFRVISEVLSRLLNHQGFHDQETVEKIIPPGSELISEGGKCYWVTPVHHGDMHSCVREQKGFTEEETRHFYRQIVALVACCHENGIVLRDLKLRKFVFTNPERTELRLENLDDVVVFDPAGDDMLAERHGCPAYVSPELLSPGKPKYSGRAADIWSLGVLLFVLLLGRYPFYDSTPFGLFMKIRQCQLGLPDRSSKGERLSREVLFLIRSLLRKAPAERLSALELMTHPWLKSRHVGQPIDHPSCPPSGSRTSFHTDVGVESMPSRRSLLTTTTDDRKTGCPGASDDQLVPSIEADSRKEVEVTAGGALLPAQVNNMLINSKLNSDSQVPH